MELYLLILEIFMYIAEAIVFLYYARAFFEQRFKTSIVIVGLAVGFSVLFALYQLDMPNLNFFVIPIVFTIMNAFLFKSSFKSSVFHALILLITMATTETITMTINASLFDVNMFEHLLNPPVYMVDIIFSKTAYSAIIMSIAYVFKTYNQNKKDKVFWMLFISPLSSVIVNVVFYYIDKRVDFSNDMYLLFSVAAVFLLFTNVVVFFVYSHSLKNTSELYDLKFEKEKQEIDLKYLRIIEQNNKNLSIIAHDTKNHLQAIRNMTDDENIIEYLERLTADLNKYSRHASSGNHNLDVIINKYVTECEIKGISFDYDVRLSNLSGVQMFDLVSILGNLLDNALESAEKSAGKSIRLQTDHRNTYDVIVVTNSCDVKPIAQGENLKSSKANKKQHGLGIKSIKSALKKYDGDYNWEYDEQNKEFTSTVMILRK